MTLERETKAYERLLHSELASEVGRYAVVAGDDLLGVYDSYNDALAAGYKVRGLESFLVQRVSTVETVAYFTRDFGMQCTQPA